MKLLLLSALVAITLAQAIGHSESDDIEWELFKVKHEKEYATDEEERERRDIFMGNLNFIREHNKKYENGEVTFTCAMNGFGDMTQDEVKASMMGFNRPAGLPRSGKPFTEPFDASLPSKVDWRTKGAVTPVKNQGDYCGSCWAFSSTGSLEGQHFLKTKKLVSLSEQNLVDCSKNGGNKGCHGGTMDAAFAYIESNKGIDTEKSYPYTAQDGKCHYKAKNRGATDSGYVDITEDDEDALQLAVAKIGPISIAMDANHTSFSYYSGGVYSNPACSSTNLDHGVLAVGYGTLNGKKYWLVKNSWGTNWGMNGYFMIARDDDNMCGVASMASYPTV